MIKKIVSKPDKKEKNTCPIERRPNEEGKCLLDGYTIIRKNKQGYDCCYKNESSSKPKEEVVKRITRSSTRVEKGGKKLRKIQIKKYI